MPSCRWSAASCWVSQWAACKQLLCCCRNASRLLQIFAKRALGRLLPTCQTPRPLLDRLPHRRIVASANWKVHWWYWCGPAFWMQKLTKATARFWPCILLGLPKLVFDLVWYFVLTSFWPRSKLVMKTDLGAQLYFLESLGHWVVLLL